MSSAALEERTVPGLHDAVVAATADRLGAGLCALDVGTGSGAFAARLAALGCDVTACDADPSRYRSPVPFRRLDIDRVDLVEEFGAGSFDVVSAIEVIEHLTAPITFLTQVAGLLRPGGVAIVTTPNLDSLPARVKFLLRGRLRLFDEWGDPTHISPIFWDLLVHRYLPASGLRIVSHSLFPDGGFVAGRPVYRRATQLVRPLLAGNLTGDCHILLLGCEPVAA